VRSWDEWRQLVDRKFDLAEGMKKGIRKGRREGMKKGMEKGIEKGIEKGKLETALAMLKKGLSLDLVAECTGLSESEILELMENPRNNGWWS
jgi:predicted transposase/invertase (TIGR01784 family)